MLTEGNDAFSAKGDEKMIEDVFCVVQRDTGEPFADEDLEDLAKTLLDATRTPMNAHSIKAAMNELEVTNQRLRARLQKLEKIMQEKQVSVVRTPLGNATFQ
jgi:hypothetical protein